MDRVESHYLDVPGHTPRVLIVSEDGDAYRQRRALLHAYGFDLLVADPAEALSLLEMIPVDYVAVDLPPEYPAFEQVIKRLQNRLDGQPIMSLRDDPSYCDIYYLLHMEMDEAPSAGSRPEIIAFQRLSSHLREENERLANCLFHTGYEWREIVCRIQLSVASLMHESSQPLTEDQVAMVERIAAAAQGMQSIAEAYLLEAAEKREIE